MFHNHTKCGNLPTPSTPRITIIVIPYDTFMERTKHSLILFCVFPYVSYYVFLFALIFLDNLPLQECTHIQHSTGVTNRDRFRSCLVRPRCSTTRSYNTVTSFDSHHNTRRSEGELWYRCRHNFAVSNSCAYNQSVSNESLVISIFARKALTDVLVKWKLPPAFFLSWSAILQVHHEILFYKLIGVV